jgi:antitoxin ParD1/3/4
MSDILTPEQHAWLSDHVAGGEFQSVEEAARPFIDESIASRAVIAGDDDLAWAKPLVDEALAAVERGEVMTRAEHRARMDARLAALKDQ